MLRFYAGGSERSGQQIVGPPRKRSPNEVVEELFKGAKEHGAVPVDRPGRGPGESSRAQVRGSFIVLTLWAGLIDFKHPFAIDLSGLLVKSVLQ